MNYFPKSPRIELTVLTAELTLLSDTSEVIALVTFWPVLWALLWLALWAAF